MRSRSEKTQPRNPHGLTTKQHVFPVASIKRFVQDGGVDLFARHQPGATKSASDFDYRAVPTRARGQPGVDPEDALFVRLREGETPRAHLLALAHLYLRKLLVVGATAGMRMARKGASRLPWLVQLLERKPVKIPSQPNARQLPPRVAPAGART